MGGLVDKAWPGNRQGLFFLNAPGAGFQCGSHRVACTLYHGFQTQGWDPSRGPGVTRNVKPPGFVSSPLDTLILPLMVMVKTMDSTSE